MDSGAKYTLARGEQRYGPYTLDQLRDYVQQGSIQPNDIVWAPGMATWRAVSEILEPGTAPLAPPPLPVSHATSDGQATTPKPPSLHWAILLLLTVATLFIFGLIWAFVQAIWVKRIDAASRAIWILAIGVPVQIVLANAGETSVDSKEMFDVLGTLAGLIMTIWAYFDMRASIEHRYDIDLSGILTFFFNIFYLQYHMRKIARNEHVPRSQQRVLG